MSALKDLTSLLSIINNFPLKLLLLASAIAAFTFVPFLAEAQDQPPTFLRENIEWADIWFPDIRNTTLPRVLLIGDSITRNYYPVVESDLKGKAIICRLTTSHFISDPILPALIQTYLDQMKFDVIQFNNGMHGWDHTEDEYRRAFPAFLAAIQDHARGAKLIWATTTPISPANHPDETDPQTDRVKGRNAIADEFVSKAGIPEDDLFALMTTHPGLHVNDGVHFTDAGEQVQGHYVSALLATTLGLSAPKASNP
jgi:hypothetical protein